MIIYESGTPLRNVFKLFGSVFPRALQISLPCSFVTAALVILVRKLNVFDLSADELSVMNNNVLWGGFTFLVGFLVVFRTSEAYLRFWEGVTTTHKMGAEWFDACSSLMAFCKHSQAPDDAVLTFQNTIIRLFSLLHAAALGDIEDCYAESKHYSQVLAFRMELIDPEGLSPEALRMIRDCDSKVELIFQWIQQLIVENIGTGVLSIPAPILTRSFQELAVGMVHFNEAMKISNVPFPFPYAQTCDALLIIHWLIVPFVVAQWVTQPWWAAAFAFMPTFTLCCLNLIAMELENPFGTDPNDINGHEMQLNMNRHLRLLCHPGTMRTPTLITQGRHQLQMLQNVLRSEGPVTSFQTIWSKMQEDGELEAPPRPVKRFLKSLREECVSPDVKSCKNLKPNGQNICPTSSMSATEFCTVMTDFSYPTRDFRAGTGPIGSSWTETQTKSMILHKVPPRRDTNSSQPRFSSDRDSKTDDMSTQGMQSISMDMRPSTKPTQEGSKVDDSAPCKVIDPQKLERALEKHIIYSTKLRRNRRSPQQQAGALMGPRAVGPSARPNEASVEPDGHCIGGGFNDDIELSVALRVVDALEDFDEVSWPSDADNDWTKHTD